MSSRRSRLQRWLAIATALLALISADGLHALAHIERVDGPLPALSGHQELHAGDCQHRPHVPLHFHSCAVCQLGHGPHVLVAAETALRVEVAHATTLASAPEWFAGAACIPGVLGARAPPRVSA
jgi:hypothetical protein